jgi:hypothetical protein
MSGQARERAFFCRGRGPGDDNAYRIEGRRDLNRPKRNAVADIRSENRLHSDGVYERQREQPRYVHNIPLLQCGRGAQAANSVAASRPLRNKRKPLQQRPTNHLAARTAAATPKHLSLDTFNMACMLA